VIAPPRRAARTSEPEAALPVLWHLKVSNFNEKARFALDYKRIAHLRRAIPPGRHRLTARRLTHGKSNTFPVLTLGEQVLGDSSEIIAALEARHPERPLYPADPEQRQRALELERMFGDEVGPAARALVLHHVLKNPRLLLESFYPDAHGAEWALLRALFPLVRLGFTSSFALDQASIEQALERLQLIGALLRAETGAQGYLVGERFSVADLTLAALLAPAVCPPQFPYRQPQRGHPLFAPLQAALEEFGLAAWVREIYSRHRGDSAEVRALARAAGEQHGGRERTCRGT
jgi:glutathione S-transferase